MRNALFGLASLLALTTVASADPLSVAAHTTDTAAPTTYVQVGLMAGGNDDLLTAGASGEVGKLVAPHIWLHGSVTEGLAGELFATGNGSILQVRAGADAMSCLGGGVLCGYVGADAGYQHTQFSGMTDPILCGDNGCDRDPVNESRDRMIGVARAGLDIGGKNLRWRPGIEATVAGDGLNGFNVTQSIAYRF